MNDTLYLEITADRDNGGFLYLVFVDNGKEPTVIASGQSGSLDEVFHQLKGITERTL